MEYYNTPLYGPQIAKNPNFNTWPTVNNNGRYVEEVITDFDITTFATFPSGWSQNYAKDVHNCFSTDTRWTATIVLAATTILSLLVSLVLLGRDSKPKNAVNNEVNVSDMMDITKEKWILRENSLGGDDRTIDCGSSQVSGVDFLFDRDLHDGDFLVPRDFSWREKSRKFGVSLKERKK